MNLVDFLYVFSPILMCVVCPAFWRNICFVSYSSFSSPSLYFWHNEWSAFFLNKKEVFFFFPNYIGENCLGGNFFSSSFLRCCLSSFDLRSGIKDVLRKFPSKFSSRDCILLESTFKATDSAKGRHIYVNFGVVPSQHARGNIQLWAHSISC